MATLTELSRIPSERPRDASRYEQLLVTWQRLRGSWPANPAEAGRDSLLYAVCLAFFYKGQTDYPDLEHAQELLDALSQCSQLDPRSEEQCEAALTRLDSLPGIAIARASTILHCLHPDDFPIVDVNAANALCDWVRSPVGWPNGVPVPSRDVRPQDMTQDPEAYLRYRRVLLALTAASRGKLTLRQVEFALYNAGRLDERVTGP